MDPKSASTHAASISPARTGVDAKTAERIFTPAGMPSSGTEVPITACTSRAVPSPPAKAISSTPASRSASAARRVSIAVVRGDGASARISGVSPAARADVSPIVHGPVTNSDLTCSLASRRRAIVARLSARGSAPSACARSNIAGPSVPLRPTAPPMPAMGLTIRPIRRVTASCARSPEMDLRRKQPYGTSVEIHDPVLSRTGADVKRSSPTLNALRRPPRSSDDRRSQSSRDELRRSAHVRAGCCS